MSKLFEPTIYEIDLIHAASNEGLLSEMFLGYSDGVAASLQLTQDNCVLLECFRRLQFPIQIMRQVIELRNDYWKQAKIEVKPIPATEGPQRSIGVAMMPYAFPNYVVVSALQNTPSIIIQGNKFERRIIPTIANQTNVSALYTHVMNYPFVKEVIQE